MKNSSFEEVESPAFAARMALSSSPEMLAELFAAERPLRELRKPGQEIDVLQRLLALSLLQPDSRFQNRYDEALAAYAWVLRDREPYRPIAERLASQAENTFWAPRIVQLLRHRRRAERPSVSTQDLGSWLQAASSGPTAKFTDSDLPATVIDVDFARDGGLLLGGWRLATSFVQTATNSVWAAVASDLRTTAAHQSELGSGTTVLEFAS